MPHLLNVWPSVSRRLRDASRVLLVLDYDGTLTPIVDRPDLAVLSADARGALAGLSRREKFLVGIVSGRSLQDVSTMVNIDGLIYAGNHGLEMRGPGLEFVHPEAELLIGPLGQVHGTLLEALAPLPGVMVENKRLTLSVHYRLTPDSMAAEVEETAAAAASLFVASGLVQVTRGKKVIEIRPNVSWNKGNAISKLRESYPDASLPVFFGDDLTDEDGFAVVSDAGGLGVYVGPARQPTRAPYRVDSPQEVVETLRLMAQT